MNLGKNVNVDFEYYVVDKKLEIIEKFRHSWTAHNFAKRHNKNYFNELSVLPKEVYEYQKKEMDNKK